MIKASVFQFQREHPT